MEKKWSIKERINELHFIEVCEGSQSMAEAASILGLHFNSFKKRDLELNCYRPNRAGIGVRKNAPKIPLKDIIEKNFHPHYQSSKLKKRLIEEGIKENRCEICGIDSWNDKSLEMELHHKDGVRTNHLLQNLVLLCPNCHSQTDTFRAKNNKNLGAFREI
ncbi:MAG: HNH endonuclease [Saprospiraceae bacterium]|nr:HNH endonuclease [Saprospiraceae bacterium]